VGRYGNVVRAIFYAIWQVLFEYITIRRPVDLSGLSIDVRNVLEGASSADPVEREKQFTELQGNGHNASSRARLSTAACGGHRP
jgi:hypothetical protein